MASNLPTFEDTAQVRPGPIVSGAPGLEAASQFGHEITGTAEKIGQNKLEKFEEAKGSQAGLNPNFSPAAGFGPEVQAFNNAALATNKQMIANDIASHSNELLTVAAQTQDAEKGLAGYTQSMHAYGQSTLENVPDANKATAMELLKYHIGNGQINLQKRVDKQNQIISGIAYENTAQSRHDSLISAINSANGDLQNPDGTPTHGGQAVGQIVNSSVQANELAARSGTISLKEMVKANKDVRDTAQGNTLLAQHSAALTHGTEPAFLKSFEANKTIGSQQKEKYFNEMMSQKAQFLQAQGVTKSSAQKNFSSMVSDIWKGGQPNQRVMTQYSLAHPELEQQATQDLNDAETGFSVVKAAIHLPANQQQAFIDARLKPTGTEPSGTFNRKLNLYNQVNHQVNNINKQIQSDPIAFGQQHPFIVNSAATQQNQQDVNAPAEAANSPNSTVRTVQPNTIQQMVDLQTQHGIPSQSVKVMSKPVATQTASQLTTLPPIQKWEYMQKLRTMYGQNMPQAISQLAKEGVPRSSFWIGSISPTDPMFNTVNTAFNNTDKDLNNALTSAQQKNFEASLQSQVVGPANDALSPFTRPSVFGQFGPSLEAEFGSNIHNYMASMSSYQTSGNVSHIGDLSQFASRVGKQYMITHGGSASNAVNTALNTVVGKFNYTTLNGATIRVPKGLNTDAIESYAKDFQHNNLPAFPFSVDSATANLRGIKDVDQTSEKVATWLENFATGGGLSTDTTDGHLLDAFNKGELETSPRQLYYNQEVRAGHWATTPDNTGLMWIQMNGKPAHTKQGKLFQFKYQDAVNNYPANYGSPTYYATQAIKYSDAKVKDLANIVAGPNAPAGFKTFLGEDQ